MKSARSLKSNTKSIKSVGPSKIVNVNKLRTCESVYSANSSRSLGQNNRNVSMSKIINNFNKGKRPSMNKIESVNNLCVKEMHEQSKVTKNI